MILDEVVIGMEIGLIYGIVAIGIFITFRIIDFSDLTCDGSFVLGTVVSGVLIKSGYNPWIATFCSLLAGCLAGLMTGIINTCFRITDLLAGILVSFMLYSINLRIMGGIPNIALIGLDTIFSHTTTILTVLFVISAMVCALLSYLFSTDFGLAIRTIGQNKRLAQNGGVNVKFMIVTGLALSNGLIAIAGALFSQHQGFADIGSGTVIVGLASVIIGEKILSYRSIIIQIISCILGSIIYRLLIGVALHSELLGLETQDLNLITGIMVICIMYIQRKHL